MTNITISKPMKMGKRAHNNTKQMLGYCKAKSFVVFDRESTHFQPNDHYGKIIELSAIKFINGEEVEWFDTLVNPEMNISEKITELTGITNEMVANAPHYKKVVDDFVSFCEGSIVVAHNAISDINFVNFFSSKIGKPFDPKYIDTAYLCKYIDVKNYVPYDKHRQYNLKAMTAKYGVINDSAHRAMSDTRATAKLFFKLLSVLEQEVNKELFDDNCLELDDISKARIGSVNYWEKNISDRLYQRIYVRLILDDKTNDIYYDFIDGCWGIKKAEFKMPAKFDFITEMLMIFLNITEPGKIYDLRTHKKG